MADHADGISFIKGSSIKYPCAPCIQGKGHSLPFGKQKDITTRPGDLIHLDVWGPVSIADHGKHHYFVTFTDDASRFCWVIPLRQRSEVLDQSILLEKFLKIQLDLQIKRVHGDNAPEHQPLASYLETKGIIWDPVPPYTKQLNGVAEIKNRYLIEPLIAIMVEHQLPKYLWGDLLLGVLPTP